MRVYRLTLSRLMSFSSYRDNIPKRILQLDGGVCAESPLTMTRYYFDLPVVSESVYVFFCFFFPNFDTTGRQAVLSFADLASVSCALSLPLFFFSNISLLITAWDNFR